MWKTCKRVIIKLLLLLLYIIIIIIIIIIICLHKVKWFYVFLSNKNDFQTDIGDS